MHLVAYDVPAHVKRLAVYPFAIRLIGSSEPGVLSVELGPAHQCRDDKLKPVLSQAASELLLRLEARRQGEQLLGRLIRVGYDNDSCDRRSLRLNEQAFTEHPTQHGPPHLKHAVPRSLSDLSRIGIVAESLHPCRQPRVGGTYDLAKSPPVLGDGCLGCPEHGAFCARLLNLSFNEQVCSVHEALGEILLLPLQRLGAGKC